VATAGIGTAFLEPVMVKGCPENENRSIEELKRIAMKQEEAGILKR